MKKLSVFISLMIGISQIVFCQTSNYPEYRETKLKKRYKTWIKTFESKTSVGYLYELKEESIILVQSSNSFKFKTKYNYREVPSRQIKKIKIRNRGKIARSTVFGTLIGFGLGGLIGLGGDDHPNNSSPFAGPAGQRFLVHGVIFSIPGTIIGTAAGFIKLKINIGGSQVKYDYEKENLSRYLIN